MKEQVKNSVGSISRPLKLIISFFKFNSLGIVNFTLFSLVFYYTKSILNWNYILCSAVSYTLVVISASLGNVFWVFRQKKTTGSTRFVFFVSTAFVYISALITELLVLKFIISTFHTNVYITQIIVYMMSGAYCFLMNYLWVFKMGNKG